MKTLLSCCWAGALLLSLGVGTTTAQSVADAARSSHKEKKSSTTVYTNDNLPTDAPITVTGPSSTAESSNQPPEGKDSDSTSASSANSDKTDKGATKPQSASDARNQKIADWKSKFAQQKDAIALLTRELDVLQREYRLRAAAFYADAGNQLRNSAKWAEEDRNYRTQIDSKQKELDAAKQKFEDMQEEARKDDMPSSVAE